MKTRGEKEESFFDEIKSILLLGGATFFFVTLNQQQLDELRKSEDEL
jgi:hypothetical protein